MTAWIRGIRIWGRYISDHGDAITDTSPPISQDQYKQLMSLLGPNNTNADATTTDSSKHDLLAGTTICLLSHSTSPEWLIDSGATYHICPNMDMFDSFEPLTQGDNINIPNGTKVQVLHKGTVKLNDDITLKNVLHVPGFCFRLKSVSKICEDLNCQMMFTNTKCFIQGLSQNRPPILLGKIANGL